MKKRKKNIKITKSFFNLLRSGERKYKNNIKKTWQVIKEAIGKEKCKQQNFPKRILVDKKSITATKSQSGPNLAKDIDTSTKSCNEYIKNRSTTQPEKVI